MLYGIVKWSVRLALRFYCKDLRLQGVQKAGVPGPVLLASNHPNSFFDAIIIGAFFPRPVHFLARGDAFARPWAARLLRLLQLIPIYRISEGRDNLSRNEDSFSECLNLLRLGGAILIFPEGICVQEWSLRSLKKGTARLARLAWSQPETKALRVEPMGLHYTSFTAVPKTVSLIAGGTLVAGEIRSDSEAHFYQQFNRILAQRMQSLLVAAAFFSGSEKVPQNLSGFTKAVLVLPAVVGLVLHYPFFKIVQRFAQRKTADSVFYDSVLFAMLYLLYPPAVLLLTSLVVWTSGESLFWSGLAAIPFCGWCASRWKSQT